MLKRSEINKAVGPLRLRARKNRMPIARLGLVVTKKGNRTAVRRNRIKRIIRDRFRHCQSELEGYDLVIQVFGELDDARLTIGLDRLFAKLASTGS